ncbi:MAG: anti-sigma factor [Dehalococcoidia bacterium]
MSAAHVDDLIDLEALGALDAEESIFVRAHTADCPRCRAILEDAEGVAARLAFSVPLHHAPRALREGVMGEVAAAPETVGEPRRRSMLDGGMIVRLSRRWGAMAAMILVAPLVGLLAWSLLLQNEVNDLKRENQQIQATQEELVLQALPTSLQAPFTPTESARGAYGTVSWNPDKQVCMVKVKHLPAADAGVSYHVYYQGPVGPRHAGTLEPDEQGSAEIRFDTSRWQGTEYQVWVSSVRPESEPAIVILQATITRN